MSRVTVSVIKADVGGFPGHASTHPQLIEVAESFLKEKKAEGIIHDFRVMAAGDDLELLMTHTEGVDAAPIHELAWATFELATERAKRLGLYGAGQDLLADAFSGNVRGMGPGIAELDILLRKSEPIVVFMMDKTEPGAFNLPIYRIFADPFNTAGLILDPSLYNGFTFEIWDIENDKRVMLNAPEDMYSILSLIGAKSHYVIKRVFPKEGHPTLPSDEPVAAISTEKLYKIAGEYVGKDDPVAIVRAQSGLPALGEVLEPFSFPHLVSGWMRGSHNGPIMPVSFADARCTRFDGPPRVIAAGFQVSGAELVGPSDLFGDPAFDLARREALHVASYMRRHGPFEPHRLPEKDMEYTTLPQVLRSLESRFESISKEQ